MKVEEVIHQLSVMGDVRVVESKAKKFGIPASNALGVTQKELKQLAREIGPNNELAIALFDTGIYEARLLCSKLYNPVDLTGDIMEYWVSTFETWEMCDSFCMGFFASSMHAQQKAEEWSRRPELFVKRAAFSIIAAYGFSHKEAPNEVFLGFLKLVSAGSSDDRHYVKKAVNWALRSIGKRNRDLNSSALELACELENSASRGQKWIGADARRELSKPGLSLLNYPRFIYG